ncbi:MAG: hypothetical protein FRX48_09210 [Lasallia pustulata]|uniref:VPS9 domain-containing protein n=1 Tax=Lasallia pustulata TaxID=136370 RepID=A0A5M8PDV0_9LECA|nr:MAG: hypothetical protein FRX48_09210 [Lasallia pustulata]
MHSLNPFLRAFFRSTLPSQCNPVNHHILLVPTTEVLLTSHDRETNTVYADLARSEDFLASHVLRIPAAPGAGKDRDVSNVRDSRGKAKQFTTINGRTVVVKESFVHSNKGFKNPNQAQLLSDALYYPDNLDAHQWLIYYISRPLVGFFEPIKIIPAILPGIYAGIHSSPTPPGNPFLPESSDGSSAIPRKKDIKSFNDLLNSFPMIARQMQPGLERVFKEFGKEFEKPLPPIPSGPSSSTSRRSSGSSLSGSNGSIHSRLSNGWTKAPSIATTFVDEEEDHMRRTLETAVTAAIDLFQLVDKQQLSVLGATTDLTGPLVERLIERYVTEQVHDSVLFPRLCNSRRIEDLELESRIHQMESIDISQIGIIIEDGRRGKEELLKRIARGVEEFRKLGVAGSPQEMMDILLATQKTITMANIAEKSLTQDDASIHGEPISEKPSSMVTMNADTLVSLLLVVVIRSQVRHLQARLTYMRNYIFIDDVESGEMGYALSTYEAVLSYLAKDSVGLRKASRRNKKLWQATMNGDISAMKAILEGNLDASYDGSDVENECLVDGDAIEENLPKSRGRERPVSDRVSLSNHSQAATEIQSSSEVSALAHVFPFQTAAQAEKPRLIKRVSMDIRSLSNASDYSFKSRTTTIDSRNSGIEGDTSIEKLTQTQNISGDSVLMMAVETRKPEAMKYLLSLHDFFPTSVVLGDCNSEGTTLLTAAVQLAHTELIEVILNHIFQAPEKLVIENYFAKPDKHGRTMAHYLFNAPDLIRRFGQYLPWRQKDKNGQTPLLALCRSYDHPHYSDMVNDALQFATFKQDDGEPLHLDDHIDSKGNTLLHVVSEPHLALRILQQCDSDANAANDKRFTPLMVASKYGRIDMVRTFFGDKRVDINAKEHRGMTAVELAKDDEIRNRIDNMVLVSNTPAPDGRVTSVVRSFFVEDGTIRLIIKSATRNPNDMIGVTTCRRSLADFENLAKWLSVEHPASWLPSIFNFRSPFQIPSRPSRAVLHDIQVRLDRFLKIMLAHTTFSTHELLWEFILAPEIQPEMMAERSSMKAKIRDEKVREEYEPVEDVRDVEIFVGHARETVRSVNHMTKSVIRRVNGIRNATSDFSTALDLSVRHLSALSFLPPTHINAFTRYASAVQPPESDPYKSFFYDLLAISSTILAVLSSLSRPHALITSITATQKAIERHTSSLRRSDRWPLGLLDDTRKSVHTDAQDRLTRSQEELRSIGSELRYTQQTVAGELAGWQDLHGKMGRRAVRGLVEGMVVRERDRLEGMRRAVRDVGVAKIRGGMGVSEV